MSLPGRAGPGWSAVKPRLGRARGSQAREEPGVSLSLSRSRELPSIDGMFTPSIKKRFFIIFGFFEKFDFFQGWAILMLTVKIGEKNHPQSWGQINFSTVFGKIDIFDGFSAPESVLDPPGWPPGPPGSIEKSKNKFWKIDFWDFFDVGPLLRYKRYFNTIIRCWDLARSIELDLLYVLT